MSIVLVGSSSGSITLQEPAVAGTTVLNLPATSGTVLTTGSTFAGTGPAFSAYATSSQTVGNGTFTKVNFGAEDFDTNSNFASSRFTPTVAGYYQINANGWFEASNVTRCIISFYKNGSTYARVSDLSGISTNPIGQSGSIIMFLNGSTDYAEVYIWMTGGGTLVVGTSNPTETFRITGSLVRAA